jgi:hypothetical protein
VNHCDTHIEIGGAHIQKQTGVFGETHASNGYILGHGT